MLILLVLGYRYIYIYCNITLIIVFNESINIQFINIGKYSISRFTQ